jgi:hypothetical protein
MTTARSALHFGINHIMRRILHEESMRTRTRTRALCSSHSRDQEYPLALQSAQVAQLESFSRVSHRVRTIERLLSHALTQQPWNQVAAHVWDCCEYPNSASPAHCTRERSFLSKCTQIPMTLTSRALRVPCTAQPGSTWSTRDPKRDGCLCCTFGSLWYVWRRSDDDQTKSNA